MSSLEETKTLAFMMNPGQIDIYDAAKEMVVPGGGGKSGDNVSSQPLIGIVSELVEKIDTRVRENLLNRIKLGLQPIEFSESQDKTAKENIFRRGTSAHSKVETARKSKFVKEIGIHKDSIIEEDYGEETSDSFTDEDSYDDQSAEP